jgi:hypothetical protein
VIAAVAEEVGHADDAPALQLAEAGADVRSRDAKSGCDGLRVERRRRQEQQRVNLGDGPVDPPAGAHFPPVEDELFLDGRQFG